MNALLGLTVMAPLIAALLSCVPAYRRAIGRTVPLLALPALVAAILVPADTSISISWLLFAENWSLNETRRVLLAAMALMWTIGGAYALVAPDTRDRMVQLALPWTVTLTGNMWLAVAQDIAGFYSGFAMMSFGAYGLIVRGELAESRAVGRLYLAFTVLGEMAILGGLFLASHAGAGNDMRAVTDAIAQSPNALLITTLLLIGFGVKCALFGMHMWLPAVYTSAPAAVRVVLGGAMINAGVLGWVSSLPMSSGVASSLASVVVLAGLIAAFGGAIVGIMQLRAATVLAYSSISQMGLLSMLVGVSLAVPDSGSAFVWGIVVFAAHHGMAKGALFIGADLVERGAMRARWMLIVPGLALAGLPLTTGAVSKLLAKSLLYESAWSWLVLWFSLASVGTTLLVARALWCALDAGKARQSRGTDRWALAVGAVAATIVIVGALWLPADRPAALGVSVADAFSLVWPIVIAVSVSALVWNRRIGGPRVTPGDVLHLFRPVIVLGSRAVAGVATPLEGASASVSQALGAALLRASSSSTPERSEAWLRRHASFLLAALLLTAVAALAFGS